MENKESVVTLSGLTYTFPTDTDTVWDMQPGKFEKKTAKEEIQKTIKRYKESYGKFPDFKFHDGTTPQEKINQLDKLDLDDATVKDVWEILPIGWCSLACDCCWEQVNEAIKITRDNSVFIGSSYRDKEHNVVICKPCLKLALDL